MDKFGVFNLLNSFFSLNGQKSPSNNDQPLSNGLDKILSALSQNLTPNTTPSPSPKPAENNKVFAPLQNAMLSTMSSHDQILKRVKEKNKA